MDEYYNIESASGEFWMLLICIEERQSMKINILGTKYKVFIADIEKKPKLKNCDGYMDPSIREIVVCKFEKGEMSIEDLGDYTNKVLRHEIIHAFLYESGLYEESGGVEHWGVCEEITDWIAIQFPKILGAFQEAACI